MRSTAFATCERIWVGGVGDLGAVEDHDVQVDGGLLLADLDLHAAGEVRGARHRVAYGTHRSGRAAAHGVHPVDLADGDAGDDRHHGVGDGGLAADVAAAARHGPGRVLGVRHGNTP